MKKTQAQQVFEDQKQAAVAGGAIGTVAGGAAVTASLTGIGGGAIMGSLAGAGSLVGGGAAAGVAVAAAAPIAVGLAAYGIASMLFAPSDATRRQKKIDDMLAVIQQDGLFLTFLSYKRSEDKVNDQSITLILHKQLVEWFPGNRFFLDQKIGTFSLADLPVHVSNSKGLLVFLTPGYLHSPNCVIELCTAVENNIKLTVLIRPPFDNKDYKPLHEKLAKKKASLFLSDGLMSSDLKKVIKVGFSEDVILRSISVLLNTVAINLKDEDAGQKIRDSLEHPNL